MRIITDKNLSKCAKWLRLLGYDTEIMDYEEILNIPDKKRSLIITKNSKLHKEIEGSIFLPFDDPEVQLFYLFKKGLIKRGGLLTRCSVCNSELDNIEKESVSGRVAPYVLRTQNEFRICIKCDKIYWNATHIEKIRERIDGIFGKKKNINIGLTSGDMNGCGPQIIMKLFLSRKDLFNQNRIFVIGPLEVFEYYKKLYGEFSKKMKKIAFNKVGSTEDYDIKKINIIDTGLLKKQKITPGLPTEHSGIVSFKILQRSLNMLYAGEIDIVVNTPISKIAVNMAGIDFKGATEFYEGNKRGIMTFFSDDMRVALFTRHIPLKDVANALNESDLIKAIEILSPYGRVGVIGLNPHAGEDGIIGNEDFIIRSAVENAKKRGMDVCGPIVSDTFFTNKCDIYLSMYHDQILPAFKLNNLKRSFQSTLGIDVKRVSVSHGTAYDKVLGYSADIDSLEYIFDLGIDMIK